METPSCLPRLLLLLLMWMMMTLADVVSAAAAEAQKPPFRGELSALPRGMDVLLGNVAPSSSGRPAPASKPDNGLGVKAPRSSTAPGQFFLQNLIMMMTTMESIVLSNRRVCGQTVMVL